MSESTLSPEQRAEWATWMESWRNLATTDGLEGSAATALAVNERFRWLEADHARLVEENRRLRELRPEVQAFAVAMEAQLRANDHKGSWKHESERPFICRAYEELGELSREVTKKGPRVLEEAADVANFVMMVADCAAWPKGIAALTSPEGVGS